MYFWKYKELALVLRNNAVTQKQYRIYLILFIVQMLITLPFLFSASVIYLVIVGVWFGIAYAVNQRGDGKDFFRRLVCLDWPITLRMLVVMLPVALMQVILGEIFFPVPPGADPVEAMPSWWIRIGEIVLLGYYLIMVIIGFRIASGQKTSVP